MALGLAVLGSTGSIGRSTLSVVDRHAERVEVVALVANRDVNALAEQVERYRPEFAVLADPDALRDASGLPDADWHGGADAIEAIIGDDAVDVVVNGIVGAAGLDATLCALRFGKRLALANKESLVAGGPLVLDALREGGGELIPIDSEHSAILQCMRGARDKEMQRIVLTASGGPFREWDADAIASAAPEDALRHPTWDMGAKITIDSATLANKALEVIEAHHLFGLSYDRIDVVVHPQSIVHSMVEFVDGSVLAQVGFPTMELPILYALTHPRRIPDAGTRFDPVAAGDLTFERLDGNRFPTFGLGVAAGCAGGTAPAVFNAANEVAVSAFLDSEIPFGAIPDVIHGALQAHEPSAADSVETIRQADGVARASAREWMEAR